MINISDQRIEEGADSYFGDEDGLDLDRRPIWRAAIKWALLEVNAPKHKQGNPFVILVEGLKSRRIEQGDMAMWLSGDKSLAVEILKNAQGHNTTEVIRYFLEKRCGEKFHDDNHLFNSFKKFWTTFKPDSKKGPAISKAHDDYFA